MNAIEKARSLKLTTIGRRSGRPHTVTLWFVPHQGKIYVSTDDFQRRDWCPLQECAQMACASGANPV